jgi:hypothetical protein
MSGAVTGNGLEKANTAVGTEHAHTDGATQKQAQ